MNILKLKKSMLKIPTPDCKHTDYLYVKYRLIFILSNG
jgi:hypothetical protein